VLVIVWFRRKTKTRRFTCNKCRK